MVGCPAGNADAADSVARCAGRAAAILDRRELAGISGAPSGPSTDEHLAESAALAEPLVEPAAAEATPLAEPLPFEAGPNSISLPPDMANALPDFVTETTAEFDNAFDHTFPATHETEPAPVAQVALRVEFRVPSPRSGSPELR